jgi:threonine/homoserine/homoserine lactone efflux protein
MFALHPYVTAALTGFVSGMLLSIPVGPINLTIMNEGARRGFAWAALIGCGATLMEVLYCILAFTGFSSLFDQPFIKAAMELFSFVFMLALGIKFLLAKHVSAPLHLSDSVDQFDANVAQRLNPRSAFWTGFVRVMANPGVLLFWIVLAASFLSRGWVEDTLPSKVACIAGVMLVQLALLWVSLGTVQLWVLVVLLFFFFCGFNVLEASQPSLASRFAPPGGRGSALGVYNTLQSLGIFAGGAFGGWLTKGGGTPGLFLCCALLMGVWLAVAWAMVVPPPHATPSANPDPAQAA